MADTRLHDCRSDIMRGDCTERPGRPTRLDGRASASLTQLIGGCRPRTLGGLIGLVFAGFGTLAAATPETEFLNANTVVMNRMMTGMTAKPTGEVDADFVNMMEPHHQGAIEMAELELRYGRNEQLRRIAQEIIVDQQQEIAAMRLAVGRPLPSSAPAPTQEDTSLADAPKEHRR